MRGSQSRIDTIAYFRVQTSLYSRNLREQSADFSVSGFAKGGVVSLYNPNYHLHIQIRVFYRTWLVIHNIHSQKILTNNETFKRHEAPLSWQWNK